MFRKYEKIHRLGKEETEGILVGTCHLQEKVDGANTSIWRNEDGTLGKGSRNQDVTGGSFQGFTQYVDEHKGIKEFFEVHPTLRLYGEWCVRHTIQYRETSYRKFYLFDIWDGEKFIMPFQVADIGEAFGIDVVPGHGKIDNPTIEELNELVGRSELGDRGEGIVIKNLDFRNSFGDLCYAKIVTQSFKEDNAIVFGGNNKHSDTYWEMFVVNKYITLPRVQKIMNKIAPTLDLREDGTPERLDMKHIPRIIGTVYHDMITEEAWEIATKVQKLDFKALKQLAGRKIKQVYCDILNESLSVADVI